MISLINVYTIPGSGHTLYNLLREREPMHSISHKALPTREEHIAFVESRPYQDWYLIADDIGVFVGAIYLSKMNEIGVFVFKAYARKGYAEAAVDLLVRLRGPGRYLANVNPSNAGSISLFSKLGFRHIQNTYELDTR